MARKKLASAAGMHGHVGNQGWPESYRRLHTRATAAETKIGSRGEMYKGAKASFAEALEAEIDMLKHLGLDTDVEKQARENLKHHGILES